MLTTFIAQPSYSDDVTINLDSTTPFVDVPVTVTEPVDTTIQTITGTPQTNPGFIDSWIELWQGAVKLVANDDGAHSATNVLASIINMPLTAGEYFIRATSFAYMCCNAYPVGSYLLSTNLIVSTPVPTPTPILPTPTETVTPTPSPSETSSEQPSPEPSPTLSETPSQPESLPDQDNSPVVQPSPESLPSVPVEVDLESEAPVEPNVLEQPVEDLTSISDPSLIDVQVSEVPQELQYLLQNDLLSLPESVQQIFESIGSALESVPGGEQVLAAAQFVNNLGSEYTPEERREAQQVILGAVIVSQLANPRRVK